MSAACCLLAASCVFLLTAGCRPLAAGCWLLVAICSLLLLPAACRLIPAACDGLLAAAGCRLLAAFAKSWHAQLSLLAAAACWLSADGCCWPLVVLAISAESQCQIVMPLPWRCGTIMSLANHWYDAHHAPGGGLCRSPRCGRVILPGRMIIHVGPRHTR